MPRILQLLSSTFSSAALRQSLIASGGSIFSGAITAVAFIIVSRALGPVGFGGFSVATALIAIFSKFGDVGLNTVITRYLPGISENKQSAYQFLQHIVWWKVLFTFFGIISMVIFQRQLASFFNYPFVGAWPGIVLGVVVLILFEHIALLLSALHEFTWYSVMNIIQALVKLIGFSFLVFMGVQLVDSVVLVYAVAPLLSLFLVGYRFFAWFHLLPRYISRWQINVRTYAPHAAVGVLTTVLIANLDLLFVQKYLSPFETGIYAGANRVAMFVSLLAISVGTVLSNRAARYRFRELQKSYLKKSIVVVLFSLLGFLCFLPFAQATLSLTVGGQYVSGEGVLIVLVANAFLTLAIMPYTSFFYALNEPGYFSKSGLIQILIILLMNLFFLPKYGLTVAAYSRLAATGALSIFTGIMIWRKWITLASKES